MRVKDSPTAPEFLEFFSEAVRKLGERFDDDPTLDMVDISLPGSWGEGHNLHLYSQESLEKLVSTYTDVFKKTQLVSQVSRPDLLHSLNKIITVGWRGDTAEMELTIENCGVAPIYKEIPLKVKFKNADGEYEVVTAVNIRDWFPGKNENVFSVKLPENMAAGTYALEIGICNDLVPMLYFCADAECDGSFYKLVKFKSVKIC